MKKIALAVIAIMMTVWAGSLQAQNYMYVYMTDGTYHMYDVETVDSVSFSKPVGTDDITPSVSSIRMAATTYDNAHGKNVANTYRFTITPRDFQYSITASTEGVVSWKISNNVVILTALRTGTTELTISSASTKKTAVLPVEVVTELESLSFTRATVAYYSSPEYLANLQVQDNVFTYMGEDGETHSLRAYLVDATVELFSDGLYINDNGEMAGAEVGYVASFPAKAYYAPAGLNNDRGFTGVAAQSNGVWSTQFQSQSQSHALTGGYFALDNEQEAMDHVKSAINYWNAFIGSESEEDLQNFRKEMIIADTMVFKGGLLRKYTYSSTWNGYSCTFMPSAIINKAAIQLTPGGDLQYMYLVPGVEMYINPVYGDNGWGVYVEQNEVTNHISLLSTSFEVDKESIHYKHVSESAPARTNVVVPFDRHVLTFDPLQKIRRK